MRSWEMYFDTATRRTGDDEADLMVVRIEDSDVEIGSELGGAVDILLVRLGKTSLRMRCRNRVQFSEKSKVDHDQHDNFSHISR